MLTCPDKYGVVPSSFVPISEHFSSRHAETLCEHDIASRVTTEIETLRPTLNGCLAFTVKETKETGDRLRAILSPWRLNDALDLHYKSNMNLRHVSAYVDAVRADTALVGDLAVSFFQVPIPLAARAWFRFRAADGQLYEYNRMSMGHKNAAELMQILTETIAGCPHATTDATHQTHPALVHDVWVDNLRLAGAARHVASAREIVARNAAHCGVTFKEPGLEITKQYDFIGVTFDHAARTVCVAPKTVAKIGKAVERSAPTTYYEALTSRLIFAAGVLRLPLAEFYDAIRTVNRYVNNLNRTGVDAVIDIARLEPEAFRVLQLWRHLALLSCFIKKPPSRLMDIAYVDASQKGWGVYIILATGELVIHGAAWPPGTDVRPCRMAALEAQAVANMFKLCGARFAERRNVDLRIDNRAVSSAMRRGVARAPELNARLAEPLAMLAAEQVRYTVSEVPSAHNWADAPSRLLSAVRAVEPIDWSRGGEGRVAVRDVCLYRVKKSANASGG